MPLLNRVLDALSNWLSPAFSLSPSLRGEGRGEGRQRTLTLRPDLDQIEALSSERDALWTRINAATFLTTDEKRAAAGYGAGGETDTQKFNPNHDDRGRFTSGPNGSGRNDLPVHLAAGGGAPKPPPIPAKPAQPPPTFTVPSGTPIRNKDLAGKKHPVTGIPFDKDGFPDFSGVAQKTVTVPHTGTREKDFETANAAAGLSGTPPGMTWHHHQDGYKMQLVPLDVHRQTGHTGSIGIGNTPGKK